MFNSITMQGRFGADPVIKTVNTDNGNSSVVNVSLAVDRGRKDKDGNKITDWFDVVFWYKKAEFASKWFHKGDMAIVRGRMESRKWEDRQGNKRISWEIQAEDIDFCNGKSEDGKGGRQSSPSVDGPTDDYNDYRHHCRQLKRKPL